MVGFRLTDIVGNCDSHQLCINSIPTKSLPNGPRCIMSVSRISPKTTFAKFAGPLLGLSSEGVGMNHVPPTRGLSAHTVLTNLEVTRTFKLRAQHMSINALASVLADRCLFGECSCMVMGCVMIDLRWESTGYRSDEKSRLGGLVSYLTMLESPYGAVDPIPRVGKTPTSVQESYVRHGKGGQDDMRADR